MDVPYLRSGIFLAPFHNHDENPVLSLERDMELLQLIDRLGYHEAWICEHHTAPWEPHLAPNLLLAQAFLQTKNIRLGPGGFLLPYHHPAELANRVAMLDHPSNRNHPNAWFVRGHGPLGTNLPFFHGPLTLRPGETRKFSPRIYLHRGQAVLADGLRELDEGGARRAISTHRIDRHDARAIGGSEAPVARGAPAGRWPAVCEAA